MEEEAFDVDEEAGFTSDGDRQRSLKEQVQSPRQSESLSARRAGESCEATGSTNITVVQQRILTKMPSGDVREDRWLQQGSLQKMFSPAFSRRGPEGQAGKVVSSSSPTGSSKSGKISEQAAKFPPAGTTTPKEIEEADLLFVPDDDQEWQRPRRPPGSGEGPSKQLTGPIVSVPAPSAKPEAQHEEEEWLERKRVTGVIGRLVQYQTGEVPAKDVLGLSRTCHGRLMVTAVRGDGPAARAGVIAGDQLISIDGEKIWEYYPAKAVLSGVRGPATLIFLGFSGKLQAEVRVKQPDEPRLGLPVQVSVSSKVLQKSKRDDDRRRRWVEAQKPQAPPSLHLLDPVVFEQSSSSSLLIATDAKQESRADADVEPLPQPRSQLGVYELHQQDAREILYQALRPQVMSVSEVSEDSCPRQHRVASRDSDVVNF